VDVILRPQGCLTALATVFTLGLYLLLRPWQQRHFIRRMDEEGVETRGGKRIAWSEFTEVVHTIGSVQGARVSNEYLLRSPKGRVSLPFWRMQNAQEGLDYLLRHLPPDLKGLRQGG
jgi:hypothetical protein